MTITPAQLEEWKRLAEAMKDRPGFAWASRRCSIDYYMLDRAKIDPQCKSSSDAITALIAEVERLRAEAEWQPIETAPKDGTPILVWVRNHADIAIWKHNILDGWLWNLRREGFFSDRWSEQPTHWRPLTPPKDSTNE